MCPLRQVKLKTLRTVGIPCLSKSYKLRQTHSPRVSFPSPAHRPVEEGLFFFHFRTAGGSGPPHRHSDFFFLRILSSSSNASIRDGG